MYQKKIEEQASLQFPILWSAARNQVIYTSIIALADETTRRVSAFARREGTIADLLTEVHEAPADRPAEDVVRGKATARLMPARTDDSCAIALHAGQNSGRVPTYISRTPSLVSASVGFLGSTLALVVLLVALSQM